MNYCSHCGSPVELKIPPGDNLPRYVCDRCGQIHYQNPKIVTGCIPEWRDKILLCKRAIEPRKGLWTLPAGFMENKETTSEAAVRETLEEANARVEPIGLYALFNIPHISQVYIMFRAKMLDPQFGPGAESLEVELFDENDIPWDNLAFPVIKQTLIRYYHDKSSGQFGLHVDDIYPDVVAKNYGSKS
jgi:ADP-ribose pyrophosphatase YjhB (NUDIX family)